MMMIIITSINLHKSCTGQDECELGGVCTDVNTLPGYCISSSQICEEVDITDIANTFKIRKSKVDKTCITEADADCIGVDSCINTDATGSYCNKGTDANTYCRDTDRGCTTLSTNSNISAGTYTVRAAIADYTCNTNSNSVCDTSTHCFDVDTDNNFYCKAYDSATHCLTTSTNVCHITSITSKTDYMLKSETDTTCVFENVNFSTCCVDDSASLKTCLSGTGANTFCTDENGKCVALSISSSTSYTIRTSSTDFSCMLDSDPVKCDQSDNCIGGDANTYFCSVLDITQCIDSSFKCTQTSYTNSSSPFFIKTSLSNSECITTGCSSDTSCVLNLSGANTNYTCLDSTDADSYCKNSDGICESIKYISENNLKVRTSNSSIVCLTQCPADNCITIQSASNIYCRSISVDECGDVDQVCTSTLYNSTTDFLVRKSSTENDCTGKYTRYNTASYTSISFDDGSGGFIDTKCLNTECIDNSTSTKFFCSALLATQCGDPNQICQTTSYSDISDYVVKRAYNDNFCVGPSNKLTGGTVALNDERCEPDSCIDNFSITSQIFCHPIQNSFSNEYKTDHDIKCISSMYRSPMPLGGDLKFSISSDNQVKYAFIFYAQITSFTTGTTPTIFHINDNLKIRYNISTNAIQLYLVSSNLVLSTFTLNLLNTTVLTQISLSMNTSIGEYLFMINNNVVSNDQLLSDAQFSNMNIKDGQMKIDSNVNGYFGRFEFFEGLNFYGLIPLTTDSTITDQFKDPTPPTFSKKILLSGFGGSTDGFNSCVDNTNNYYIFATSPTDTNPACIYTSDFRIMSNAAVTDTTKFLTDCTSSTAYGLTYFLNQSTIDKCDDADIFDYSTASDQNKFESCKYTGMYYFDSSDLTKFRCSCSDKNYDYHPLYSTNINEFSCSRFKNVELSRYNISIPLTSSDANTGKYSMNFWIYINYSPNKTYDWIAYKWNDHLMIKFSNNSIDDSNSMTCYPILDSNSENLTINKSDSIDINLDQWNYVRCAVDKTAAVNKYYSYVEGKKATEKSLNPFTFATSSSYNFEIDYSNRNFGVHYMRMLYLWDCYKCEKYYLQQIFNQSLLTGSVPDYSNALAYFDFKYDSVDLNTYSYKIYSDFDSSGTYKDSSLFNSYDLVLTDSTNFNGYSRLKDKEYFSNWIFNQLDSAANPAKTTYHKLQNLETLDLEFNHYPLSAYTMEMWIQYSDLTKLEIPTFIIVNNRFTLALIKDSSTIPKLTAYYFPDEIKNKIYDIVGTVDDSTLLTYITTLASTEKNIIIKTTTLATTLDNMWIFIRIARSEFKGKYYMFLKEYDITTYVALSSNTDTFTEKKYSNQYILFKPPKANENTYNLPFDFNSYQIKSKLKLYEVNSGTNTFIRSINIYNDYLPDNLDTRFIDFMAFDLTTYPTYLVFSTSIRDYQRGFQKLEFLEIANETITRNTYTWSVKSTSSIESIYTVVDLPQCNPSSHILDTTNFVCTELTGIQCGTNHALCISSNEVLSCTEGYYIDISNFTCHATQYQCPSGYVKSPGTKESGLCDYQCLYSVNNYSAVCSNYSMSLLETNLTCSSEYFNYNYKCESTTLLNINHTLPALYYNSCFNSPNFYINIPSSNASLTSGYFIDFVYKRDNLNDRIYSDSSLNCDKYQASSTLKKYIFYSNPHEIYIELTTDDTKKITGSKLVYKLNNGSSSQTISKSIDVLSGDTAGITDSLNLADRNIFLIEVQKNTSSSTIIGSVNVYINFSLFGSLTNIPKFVDGSSTPLSLSLSSVGFCMNKNCNGRDDITSWFGGWYKYIKVWDAQTTNIKLLRENDNSLLQPVNYWDFDFSTYKFFEFTNRGTASTSFSFFDLYSETSSSLYYTIDSYVHSTGSINAIYYEDYKYISSQNTSVSSSNIGLLTMSNCIDNCIICHSGDICLKCDLDNGYTLFNGVCTYMNLFFLSSNLDLDENLTGQYSQLALQTEKLGAENNMTSLYKLDKFSFTINIRFFRNVSSGCAKIFEFSVPSTTEIPSDYNTSNYSYLCFDSSDGTLKYYGIINGVTELLLVDSVGYFRANMGTWMTIGITASYSSSSKLVSIFKIYVGGYEMSIYVADTFKTAATQATEKARKKALMENNKIIHGFKVLNQIKAIYANYRIYNELILNPEGISVSKDFSGNNLQSLLRHLPLYVDYVNYDELENSICQEVMDNRKGIDISQSIKNTLTCYRDYNPYVTSSNNPLLCPAGQYINTTTGGCSSCDSTCKYCSNSSSSGCSSNFYYDNAFVVYDEDTDSYNSMDLQYLDWNRYYKATAKANISNTQQYAMDFWFYGCAYTNDLEATSKYTFSFPIIWDKHLAVMIEFVAASSSDPKGCTSITNTFGQDMIFNFNMKGRDLFNSKDSYGNYNFCWKVNYLPIYDSQVSSTQEQDSSSDSNDYLPICAWRKIMLGVKLQQSKYKAGDYREWTTIKQGGVDKTKLVNLKPVTTGTNLVNSEGVNQNYYNITETVDFSIGATTYNSVTKKSENPNDDNFGIFHLSSIRLWNYADIFMWDCSIVGNLKYFESLLHYFNPNNYYTNIVDSNTSSEGLEGRYIAFNDTVVSTVKFSTNETDTFESYNVLNLQVGEKYNKYVQKDEYLLYYEENVDYFTYLFPTQSSCTIIELLQKIDGIYTKIEKINNGETILVNLPITETVWRITYWCKTEYSDIECEIPIFGQNEGTSLNYTVNIINIDSTTSGFAYESVPINIGVDIYYNSQNNIPTSAVTSVKVDLTTSTTIGENSTDTEVEQETTTAELTYTTQTTTTKNEVNSKVTENEVKNENEINNCYSGTTNSNCVLNNVSQVTNIGNGLSIIFGPSSSSLSSTTQTDFTLSYTKKTDYNELCDSKTNSAYCSNAGTCITILNSISCSCIRNTSGKYCSLSTTNFNYIYSIIQSFFNLLMKGSSSTNRVANSNINTRILQTNSTFIENFSASYLKSFNSITNLASITYTDVETPSNTILPILVAIDENIDTSDNVRNVILNDYSTIYSILKNMYDVFLGNINSLKSGNLVTYLKTLDKSATISPPVNITFTNVNSTSSYIEAISFVNVTEINKIYELLHNTGNYDSIESSITLSSNNYYNSSISQITNELHTEYSLTDSQRSIISQFLTSAESLLLKLNKLKVNNTSTSTSINYQFSSSYYKVVLKDITTDKENTLNSILGTSSSSYSLYVSSDDLYNNYLSSLNKFTVSYVVIKAVDKDIGYSNTSLTPKIQVVFYDETRKSITQDYNLDYHLTLSTTNKGINDYIIINADRFYKDMLLADQTQDQYVDLITQPFIISTEGEILRNYTQSQRISDMHQYIDIYSTLGASNVTLSNIKYEQAYIVVSAQQGETLLTNFEYITPNYKNQSNDYWWGENQIFKVSDNYNRACFIFLIISCCIYLISITIFMILSCIVKKNNNSELSKPINVGTGVQNKKNKNNNNYNSNNDVVIIYPSLSGANNTDNKGLNREESNDNDNNVDVVKIENNNKSFSLNSRCQEVNFNSLSSSKKFFFYIKSGIYSGILRSEKAYSPRYKDLAHLWLFQYFMLVIITLLFNFTDLNTAKSVSDNWHMYLWFSIVAIIAANILIMIVSLLYSSSEKAKVAEKSSSHSLVKSIIIIIVNLGLFGFLFYAMTGFAMVFEKYDYVLLVTYIICLIVDFLIFDILLVSFAVCSGNENSSCCKTLLKIMSVRRST